MPTVATATAATPTPVSQPAADSHVISLPKTPFGTAIEAMSGTNVAAAKAALKALDQRSRDRLFGLALPGSGLVPVLDAARRGVAGLIALYAGMGAALNVTDDAGRNAIFMALFEDHYGTAKALLRKPKLANAMFDKEPVLAADVEKGLAAFGEHPTYKQVSELIEKLSANPGGFESDMSAAVYLTNAEALADTSIFKNVGEGEHKGVGQGWVPQFMAAQRARTLLLMAVRENLSPADRAACLREAALFCETSRLDRRIFSATDQTPDAAMSRLVVEHEAENLLRKLDCEVADGNTRLVAFVIPVATPHHTTYMTVEPAFFPDGTAGYMMHYDNRGYGNGSHKRAANNEVYPRRTSIPSSPEMRALLKTLLIDTLLQRRKEGTVENIYGPIDTFFAGVKALRGESPLDDPTTFDPLRKDWPSYPQDAGDCNFANADPGLDRRMGPALAARFRAFEAKLVRERCARFVDPNELKRVLTANDARKERDHAIWASGGTPPAI